MSEKLQQYNVRDLERMMQLVAEKERWKKRALDAETMLAEIHKATSRTRFANGK